MGRTFPVLVCALLAWPALARAQRFDDVGVRAQGMAGAFVAVADDASATWWNPAGLAGGMHLVDLSAEATEGGGRGVALGFPSLGVSYYRLKISQIQPSGSTALQASDRQDNGAAGSGLPFVDASVSQFGVTVGQSLTSHLVVATTLKLVNALSATHPDLDAGIMAAAGVLRVGVAVRDITEPTFVSGASAFDLTRRARAGAAVVLDRRGPFERLTLSFDADLTSAVTEGRDEREVAGGVEAWWFGQRLGLRGGVGANTVGGGGSFGAVGVTLAPVQHLNLDGALTRGEDSARDRWTFGLRVTF
ncbi:MAG TPA: hypothetical protein VG871_21780 [Vicinamibacterales bacterium]|nr:hypothetical protein [Vicinamibacterales bacterium]